MQYGELGTKIEPLPKSSYNFGYHLKRHPKYIRLLINKGIVSPKTKKKVHAKRYRLNTQAGFALKAFAKLSKFGFYSS